MLGMIEKLSLTQKRTILFTIGIILLLGWVVYLMYVDKYNRWDHLFEGFENTAINEEAIQNIASVYNNDLLVVSNSEIQNTLKAKTAQINNLNISGNTVGNEAKYTNLVANKIQVGSSTLDATGTNLTGNLVVGGAITGDNITTKNGIVYPGNTKSIKIDSGIGTTSKDGNLGIIFKVKFNDPPIITLTHEYNEKADNVISYIRSRSNVRFDVKTIDSISKAGKSRSFHWIAVGN